MWVWLYIRAKLFLSRYVLNMVIGMSCKVKIDTFTAVDASEAFEVRLMPCKIDYNGEAKVKQYFNPVVTPKSADSTDVLTASFRGRPLEGQKLPVPKGYIGVVLRELPADVPLNNNGDCERRLAVTHKFKDFTYWNLDLTPSANDKIMQVMKWIDIAKVIHQTPTAANESNSNSSQDSDHQSQ